MVDAKEGDPVRVQLLTQAIGYTSHTRNKSYGDPQHQLACAAMLKQTLRQFVRRALPAAELEALDMVCTKLSRAVCGPHPGLDTYIDGAAYFAIAGEAYSIQEAGKLSPQVSDGPA